ncbi:hypothetical protein Tco_0271364 [Tanacetum coccineum]
MLLCLDRPQTQNNVVIRPRMYQVSRHYSIAFIWFPALIFSLLVFHQPLLWELAFLSQLQVSSKFCRYKRPGSANKGAITEVMDIANRPGMWLQTRVFIRMSIGEDAYRPGSSVNMLELLGYSYVVDNGESSVTSNADSTSNIVLNTRTTGLLILLVPKLDDHDIRSSSFSRDTGSIGPPSTYAHLRNCDHSCQHCGARFLARLPLMRISKIVTTVVNIAVHVFGIKNG